MVTPEQVAAMEARLEAARNEVDDLCHHKHGWRMCIPVHQADSDVVISTALNDLRTLLDALRAPAVIDAEVAAARKRFNVAYNLATWDGDWETAAIAAVACIQALERKLAARDDNTGIPF